MGPATPLAPPTGFDAPAGFRVPTVGTTAEPGLFAGPSGIPAPNAAGFVGPSGEAMSAADYAAQMARYPVNNGVGLPGYAPGPYAGFPGSTQPGTALELYRGGLANIPGTDLATLPGTDLATYGSRSLAQTPGTALELYRGGGAVDLFGGGSAVNPGMFGAPTGPAMPGPTGFPAPTGFAAPTGPAGIAPTGFGAPTGVAVPGMAPPITPTAITKELQAALDQAMGKGGKLTSRILSYQPQELLGYERTKTAAELAIREAIASGSTAEEAIAAGAEASGVGANLVKGSIGRAGLYGLAGEAGNYALKKILGGERDGSWDNAAGGAMRGAGWGAGVGSVVPVIGTALGAGVGALAGGAIGYFTGHDSAAKQTRDYWANQLDAQNMSGLAHSLSGLSPMTQSQVLSQIGMIQNTTKSPEEAKALVSQILLNLPAIAQQEDMYRANSAQQAANARYVRDTLMPKFTGYLDQSRQDAGNWALQQVAASQGMRNKNLGQIYAANASALPLAIDRQNASYMSQLAAIQQMQQPTSTFYPSILGGGSTVAPYTSPYGVPNTGILAGVNP